MIADSKNNLFDVILVWKLDRFSRDKYDSAHYKFMLKNNNVRVISATEPIDETPEGQLMESIFEGFAAYYVAELAVKVNRGLTENALKCKFNGGSVPFGFKIDADQHFQIDPVSAPIVREVYVDYADGKTIQAIINELNARGIRTSRGGRMTINVVTHMLKNRRYIGEYKYKDVLVENAFDPIISNDLFDIVQEKMGKNKKAPARKKEVDESFILTTKLICGKCGAFMAGESGTGKSGKKHYYYKCSHAKNKKTCDKQAIKKDWIENLIFEATAE
jgi:DNA invertase Pin-like site-specific DNA recombinase